MPSSHAESPAPSASESRIFQITTNPSRVNYRDQINRSHFHGSFSLDTKSLAQIDLAKHTAPEGDGALPDNASSSMQSTAANDGASRGTSTIASSAMTPATEHVPSTHHPQPLASAANAGAEASATSPMRNGFTPIETASTVGSDVNVTRATTESPSESKYDRMLGNQADAAANRVAREQNLMRGAMNRRARAASEGFPSSGMVVEAPLVAKKAQAGQFIILRVHEDGERIPLTVADYDREKGTITIIFQIPITIIGAPRTIALTVTTIIVTVAAIILARGIISTAAR